MLSFWANEPPGEPIYYMYTKRRELWHRPDPRMPLGSEGRGRIVKPEGIILKNF